ncbi:MAG: preprotein translocase subunit SecE [Clostridiales bacterium]|jgi:preprotein translocase SecE subunit|nr:preprotein translocase subunit SecE [Clostridiales bacterium]
MSEKPTEKKKLGAKTRSLFGELKKVSWPGFSKVVSQTGLVLAVTVFFLAVLMLMDFGLGQLYNLLISGFNESSVLPLLNARGGILSAGAGALSPLAALPL